MQGCILSNKKHFVKYERLARLAIWQNMICDGCEADDSCKLLTIAQHNSYTSCIQHMYLIAIHS